MSNEPYLSPRMACWWCRKADLPLCYACSKCGGHIAADDTRCVKCGHDESERDDDDEALS